MAVSAKEGQKRQLELLANTCAKGLAKRNMTAHIAHSADEVKEIVASLVDEGATLARGGSKTVDDLGLVDYLEEKRQVKVIKKEDYANAREHMLAGFASDVYLASANAISADGVIVNIDGNSNRVAAIAQGPLRVILVVGINKVMPNFEAALSRARNIAAPQNAARFECNTPCTRTGICADCKSLDTVCCQFLITRFSRHADRIHVVLLTEDMGF